MISYSKARTQKNLKYKILLLSLGMIVGLVFETMARTQLTLEQHTAEIVKLEAGVSEIFVADPEIADIQLNSPTVAYIYAKGKVGRTSVIAADKQGRTILQMDVEVIHNLGNLKRAIKAVHPKENVKILSAPEGLILEGTVANPKASKDIANIAQRYLTDKQAVINNLRISEPTQVYLKVKVAEVSRTVLNQLDINWAARADIGSFTFGLLTGREPFTAGAFNRFINSPNPNSIGFRGTSGSSVDITALLDALNSEGLGSVLAEPNLVCLSGDTASVLVGGEFPYPVPQEQSITIEFKQFGISLAFTPTILSGELINLRVRPEVSELDRQNQLEFPLFTGTATIPAIKTRRAETSVELGSGDSLAIAGLFSNVMSNTLREVPGLGDIPILGALFRSARFQRNETELVIIVTPYIVQPVSSKKLQAPTDNLKYASFLETILLNRLNTFEAPYCPPCDSANPAMTNVAATNAGADVEGVIFEKPLSAIVDAGSMPSDAPIETERNAVLRQEEVELVGETGFYTE